MELQEFGVIYIATGDAYIKEALVSATSLKKLMPKVPVTLFTHRPVDEGVFDNVVVVENPTYSFFDKVTFLKQSPYKKTVFLDSDTLVCGDFSDLFELLNDYEVAAAYDAIYRLIPLPNLPTAIPEFNSGVIAFRQGERWHAFCDKWREAYVHYQDFGKDKLPDGLKMGDQTPFLDTLHHSDLRHAVLPENYNCPVRFSGFVNGQVKILHGRHYNLEAIAEALNADTGMRIHYLDYDMKRVIPYQNSKFRASRFYLLRKRSNYYLAQLQKKGAMGFLRDIGSAFKRRLK